jgi:protein involved in polysaccharide export with SLBB domain
MKNLTSRIFKILMVALFLYTSLQLYAQEFSNYRLGVGDKISIEVFNEKDLSIETTLTDAGTISYPFLGEIKALGVTIGTLSQLITRRLADGYLINPSVNVKVIGYREFYINGEVEKPGAYPFQPGLTLQRAIALAGGLTERASSSKQFILRDGQESREKVIPEDKIMPGDVITIDESFF